MARRRGVEGMGRDRRGVKGALAVIFGLALALTLFPGRPEPRRRRAAEPAPAPDARRDGREEHGLRVLPRRHRADARDRHRQARLRRLPRRRREAVRGRCGARQRRVPGRDGGGARRAALPGEVGGEGRLRAHQLGEPGAQLHAAQPRVARVHPLLQPGRPARRAGDLRRQRVPRRRGAQGPEEHHDDDGAALGRRRVQQRRRLGEELHLRRVVRARRHAAEDQHRAAADGRGHREGRAAVPGAAAALERHPGARSAARVREGRQGRPLRRVRGRQPEPRSVRRPARPRRRQVRHPRARHRPAHQRRGAEPAQEPPERPGAVLPRHQRPPRRLPLERLHRLPRGVRERPRAHELGPVREVRQHGLLRGQGSDDPARRARPPDPAPPDARHPDQPVHDLPHAPAERVREPVPRLPVVGLRDRRRPDVAEGAALPDVARSRGRSTTATRRRSASRCSPIPRAR